MPAPGPEHIVNIASGYGISKALLSAVGLGLYTYLAGGPKTLDDIMAELGLHRRPAMAWLGMLVSVDQGPNGLPPAIIMIKSIQTGT